MTIDKIFLPLVAVLVTVEFVLGTTTTSLDGPSVTSSAVTIDQALVLECSNEQPSSIHWKKGSILDQSTQSISPGHMSNFGLLYISSYQASDSGQYSCYTQHSQHKLLYSCPLSITDTKLTSEFLEEPQDVTVMSDMAVVLRCSVDPPTSHIYWEKDGKRVNDTLYVVDGDLLIPEVSEDDMGEYRCVAENAMSSTISYSRAAKLNVTEANNSKSIAIEFLVKPLDTTAVRGETVRLWCVTNTGEPVTWEHVGQPSLPQSATVLPSDVLVLEAVGGDEAGAYRCSVGDSSVDATLTVVDIPSPVITSSTDITEPIEVGTTITLTCYSNNALTGPADVVWQIGGVVKKRDTSSYFSSLNLEITSDYISDDNVVWIQCLMSGHGCSHTSVAITATPEVIEIPPPRLPTIEVSPKQATLAAGENISVMCTVNIVKPYMLVYTDFPGLEVVVVGNNLTATISTPGVYTCTAFFICNNGSNSLTLTDTINVAQEVPPPTLVVSPKEAAIPAGGSVNVTCVVTQPSELFFAEFLGTEASSPSGVPLVAEISSPGIYTCTAYFTSGLILSDTVNVTTHALKADVLPDTAMGMEGTSIELMCTTAGGSSNVSLTWTHDRGTEDFTTTTSAVSSILVVSSLTADHHGLFKCTVTDNIIGSTVESVASVIVKPSPPTATPTSIVTSWYYDGSSSIGVVWTASPDNNLLGYKLSWSPTPNTAHIALAAVGPATFNYRITGLNYTQIYTVLVWGYSLGGDGPYISSTVPKYNPPTPDTPITDPPVPDPTSLDLALTECSSTSSSSAVMTLMATSINIAEYHIRYACQDTSNSQEGTYLLESSKNYISETIILTRLIPGCNYTAVATAYGGQEQVVRRSEACHFVMPYDAEYINFNVSWTGSSSLTVTWLLPTHLQSHNDIEVELRLYGEEEWIPIHQGSTVSVLGQLDLYTEYQCEVRVTYSDHIIYTETLTVPAQATPTSEPSTMNDLWLTYGIGIAGLLVACLIMLSLILVCKHIQSQRRENDKVINHREKKFDRSSHNRLSTKKDNTAK